MASAPGERSSAAETRSWTHASETTRHTSKYTQEYSPDGRQDGFLGEGDNVGFGNRNRGNPSVRDLHTHGTSRCDRHRAWHRHETGTEAPAHDVTSHASLNNTFARRQNKLESASAALAPELSSSHSFAFGAAHHSFGAAHHTQLRGCSRPPFFSIKTAFTTSAHATTASCATALDSTVRVHLQRPRCHRPDTALAVSPTPSSRSPPP